jgi:hypothetical protein
MAQMVTRSLRETRRHAPHWLWSSAAFLLSLVSASLFVPSATAATGAPEVRYLAASDVSTTGATIEVPINPEGSETSYEIQLECQNAQENNQSCEPLTVGPQRQQGVLAPGFTPQIVTDVVTGLQPGYLYKYLALATNSAGRGGYVGDGLETCPSEGLCPSQPFLIGISWWVIEALEQVGREAPLREAEREAKQREEAERPAKEAAERAAKEREIREAGERAGREAAERAALARLPKCVVPRLKGDSLTDARRALGRAHCGLGRLTKPRDYRGPLVVVKQGVHSGSKLAAGSRVALTLRRDGEG